MAAVSVVVVTHNSEHHVERCLSSLEGGGYEVVVVDSASADGTVDLVRRGFRDVGVVELGENVGFGAASNVGIHATTGPYVLVLNSDAWPLEAGVERLVAAAGASPRAGVVGPHFVDGSGRHVGSSVRAFPTVWRLATVYFFLRYLAPWSRALNAYFGAGVDTRSRVTVDWVAGAAMLARRRALEDVGFFDPSFFMYAEETDLAFRLGRAGWDVVYEPRARFVHLEQASSGGRPLELHREEMRAHVRFLEKHYGSASAERGRKLLLWAMRLRSVAFRGERRRLAADAATWLGARNVDALLADPRAPERR
jgi:N-acetylglucosaminyl-diphospho-decaprenol L-rhamnosyltransferase